ncbi:MAG: hypothetical protein ABJ327_02485 [Litoreibacter sp.]
MRLGSGISEAETTYVDGVRSQTIIDDATDQFTWTTLDQTLR